MGNATVPLIYFGAAVLLFCILSGKWILLAYLAVFLLMYLAVLLYTVYLEYNVQDYLEKEAQRLKRERLRLGRVRL